MTKYFPLLLGLLGLWACKKSDTTPVTPVAPITSTGQPGFFLYDQTAGTALFGEVVNSTFKTIKSYDATVLGTGWSHVVPLQGKLFLYKKSDGSVALFDGVKLTNVSNQFAVSDGWSTIVPFQDKYLLFYVPTSGASFIETYTNGTFTQTGLNAFSPNWTDIVPTSDNLLFYNNGTGSTVLGTITSDGKFSQQKNLTLSKDNFFQPYQGNFVVMGTALNKSLYPTKYTLIAAPQLGTLGPVVSEFTVNAAWSNWAYANNTLLLYNSLSGVVQFFNTKGSNDASTFGTPTQTSFDKGITAIVAIGFN